MTGPTDLMLDEFLQAYIEAALWSSSDELDPETGGDPMDKNYGRDDLAPETEAAMRQDCSDFLDACGRYMTGDSCLYDGCSVLAYAGHDFWLTRCGHGAGFWDGDWTEPEAGLMVRACDVFGSVCLYVGDDGRIYQL